MPCGGSCSPGWALTRATRAYVERRTAEGKSKAEIIRCLKRYVAREVYPHLRAGRRLTPQLPGTA